MLLLCACGSNEQPVDAGTDTAPDAIEEPEEDTGIDTGVDSGPPPVVWAHTESALYRFDVPSKTLTYVADFSCAVEQVQDIAIDVNGAMVGVTLSSLVAIDPATAVCKRIALGAYPRSLAFAPAGILDAGEELVGFNYVQYLRIDRGTGAVSFAGALMPGMLNFPVAASGDLTILPNGRGFLTATGPSPPNQDDLVLEFDPKTGKALRLVRATGVPSLLGLASWQGNLYAFSASGHVYRVTPNGAVSEVLSPDAGPDASDASGISFSGAAVSTSAP